MKTFSPHAPVRTFLCITAALILVLSPLMLKPGIPVSITAAITYAQDATPPAQTLTAAATGNATGGTNGNPSSASNNNNSWLSFLTDWASNTKYCVASPLRCVFAGVSTGMIFMGNMLLQMAGGLFDVLMNWTIIHFGDPQNGLLRKSVQDAINTTWTALRDVANILIVGFFVFLAINIIIGAQRFGDKKLIANVIIVAVLINFSLLFTKVIIDFSNYTATQFYNAGIKQTVTLAGDATTASGASDTSAASQGNAQQTQQDTISQHFMRLTRTTSLGSTFQSIHQAGDKNGNTFMFFYAILVLILTLYAAAVLFYGCFILLSRAILLVFLMVTAALAFTTYLLPSDISKQWWGAWWQSLLKSAVLAPLLMIFLWATLTVSEKLVSGGGGSLGDLAEHPAQASDLGTLFSFIVIFGLLFATFKMASSLSTSISGFNWASIAPAIGLAAGARLAGALGQQASIAANRGLSYGASRIPSKNQSLMASLGRGALYGAARQMAKLGAQPRNIMNTAAGGVVANQVKGTGLNQKNLAGRPPGGFSAINPAAADRAAKAIKDAADKQASGAVRKEAAASSDDKSKLTEAIKEQQKENREAEAQREAKQDEHNKQLEKTIQEASASGAKATEEMGTKLAEGQVKAAEASGKAAGAEVGEVVREGNREIRQAVKETTTAINDTKNLQIKAGAAAEHDKSDRRAAERFESQRISAAHQSAQTTSRQPNLLSDLRDRYASQGTGQSALSSSQTSSSLAPAGTPQGAAPSFTQVTGGASNDAIVRQIRNGAGAPGSVSILGHLRGPARGTPADLAKGNQRPIPPNAA